MISFEWDEEKNTAYLLKRQSPCFMMKMHYWNLMRTTLLMKIGFVFLEPVQQEIYFWSCIAFEMNPLFGSFLQERLQLLRNLITRRR